jgi:hypothetical protein
LQAHLASVGLKVTAHDVRRFCTDAKIKRDVRAGRPNASATSARRSMASTT